MSRSAQRTQLGADEVDEALFAVTTCEEAPLPMAARGERWHTRCRSARPTSVHSRRPSSPPSTPRTRSARAAHRALRPLARRLARAAGSASPLPNVPTLILSGEQDLRTPTSNALAVAALIPDAQVLVVPYTGHSVVGSDLSGCTAKALDAFFAG